MAFLKILSFWGCQYGTIFFSKNQKNKQIEQSMCYLLVACYRNENSFPIQPKTYKELVKIKKEFKSAEDKIHFDFVWTNFERTNKTRTVWKNIEKTIVQGVEKLEEVVDGSVRRRNEKESGKEKNLKKMFR